MITPWLVAAPMVTLGLYSAVRHLHESTRSRLLLPIVLVPLLLIAIVLAGHLDLAVYQRGSRPISWLLGPATVALAIPLHRARRLLRANARAIFLAVSTGAVVGIASAVSLARALGLAPIIVRSLAPKSVTTPIAMPIAERLGGLPSLTAAVVVVTGVLGLIVGPSLLTTVGIRSPLARGLAMGTSAHGVGTARALEEGPVQGAASGVAMVIAGVVTATLAATIVRLLADLG